MNLKSLNKWNKFFLNRFPESLILIPFYAIKEILSKVKE